MATTTSITTSYAGKFAGEYIFSALKAGDTLAKDIVTVKPNVKEPGVTVKRLSTDGIIKGSSCDFSPTSTITLDDRKLVVKKLQVNLQTCKEDFEVDWDEESMGSSAFTDLPPSFEAAIIEYLQARVAQDNDRLIWQGTDGADEYDGFTTLIAADAGIPAAQDLSGAFVDKDNVIETLQNVYDAIPDNMIYQGDIVIAVAYNVAKAYQQALSGFGTAGLGAAGYQNNAFVGEKPLDFLGLPMFAVSGMPTSDIVVYNRSEFWFGTGVLSDWNEIRLLDMADLDASQNIRMVMRFYGGVQYAFSENIVYYNGAES
ncbi:MAG: hypothetical protein HRU18_27580 [Pseudoalteromonas sp.]|uniref:hypothetical protein n=1 Tax=Pseudoalteromonas sp. TaxID=53249 RepID=UPI001DF4F2AB|nr:hypothetical protein [Pseudoalteromonas sp.]NRA81975.1 hypothetical protein [Pseudoalteromonas sp.]